MQTFIDYLTQAAPEGETILLVKQKPRIYDGQPALHNDGTPKYSWPPFLPERYKQKPAAAWYANTAIFIVDRFKDGKLSAGAAYCKYVAFMVLDDIGTKSKTPPLEPSWKLETSLGNYQWGYTFEYDAQPLKEDFAAAILAIAEAGYTDGGAINPVRNFRVPGSINLKPGRDNFEARLVEFHPDRFFTLPQIIEAFGVTPKPADTASYKPLHLDDDGNDAILAWLTERGLVLSAPNGEGWTGVVCPNASEHSDHNPEGRYHPVHRAYDCFHEHCGDWTSERFLRWVEAEGGPKAGYGLRDELLAMTMNNALSKITPTEAYPDAAQQVVEEVRRRELGRLTKNEWYERFAYLQDDDAYFDLVDRREISRGTFNALYRHVSCRSIRTNRAVEASVCFDEHRQEKGAHSLIGVTYAAGEDLLVSRAGYVYGNRWRNARPEGRAGDVTPWLTHLERMVPDSIERAHVINVMAHKVQRPHVKINHAVLHAGKPGAGKDTLWAPLLWAVGGPTNVNVSLVRNEELTSQWGYTLEAEIMVINELRQAEAKDRRALENQLKPVIAAPPELLPINRKGLHPYDALNRIFVLAFSNERAAISLPSDDRRWFVLWSEVERLPEREAVALWEWYRKAGGFEAIACWLSSFDISRFNAGASPPMTEAKAIMIDAALSTAESYLVEMLRARVGEFSRGVIGSPFHVICDRVGGAMPPGVKVPQSALFHALREAGWVDLGRVASGDYPSKKHLFCAPDMVARSKSELRRLVEVSGPPSLAVVK